MNFGRMGKTNYRFYGFRRYATDFINAINNANKRQKDYLSCIIIAVPKILRKQLRSHNHEPIYIFLYKKPLIVALFDLICRYKNQFCLKNLCQIKFCYKFAPEKAKGFQQAHLCIANQSYTG